MPRPTRIIAQIPCPTCVNGPRLGPGKRHFARYACGSHYIALPRSAAIFPPLHACRESRCLFFKHFDYAPRCTHPNADACECNIWFEFPFISYETDIFTHLYRHWKWGDDPFEGLDRTRIQHVGLRSGYTELTFTKCVWDLDLSTLPSLRSLSLIMLGPTSGPAEGGRGWSQMDAYTLAGREPSVEFEVRDISPTQLELHPFFNHSGIIKSKTIQTGIPNWIEEYDERPKTMLLLVKALLWHYAHRDRDTVNREAKGRLAPDYMAPDFGPEDKPCPLPEAKVEGCGPGHTRQEILDWVPPYQLGAKFLCERGWLADLEHVGVLDDERTRKGDFAAFHVLRDKWMGLFPSSEDTRWVKVPRKSKST